MEELSEIFSKISLSDYNIGEYYWVHITHINHPHSFYVRPVDYKHNMDALETRGDQLQVPNLTLGKNVVYNSKTLKSYVRGQIVYIQSDNDNIKCDVKAIDYGCIDQGVSLWRLHKPQNDIPLPPLAIHCQLSRCKPLESDTFEEEAIDAMKTYVGTERAKMLVKAKDSHQLIVDLINSCPDDIATLMALTHYTTMGYDGKMDASRFVTPKPDKKHFTYKPLKLGDTLHVRVQTGNSLDAFYVAEVEEYKQYIKERDDFTDYCHYQKYISAEDASEGRAVGVLSQSSSKFERGIIVQVIRPKDRAVVKLVDWGNTIEVSYYQMRVISSKVFFDKPILAIYCCTESKKTWDNGLQKFLYPGYEFLIKIKHLGDAVHYPHTVFISRLPKK